MAQIVDIADAVVEELNGHEFSQEFTAVRLYVPRYKPQDIKDLTVTVVPGPHAIEGATRGSDQHEYTILVGVQMKLDSDDAATLDPMVSLVEEVADFLGGRPLASVPLAVCSGVLNEEPLIPEHLDQLRIFTSFVSATYQMVR